MFETRLTVSHDGDDDWGIGLGLYNNQTGRIGSITYRNKSYLKNMGYPMVNKDQLTYQPYDSKYPSINDLEGIYYHKDGMGDVDEFRVYGTEYSSKHYE